MSYESEMLLEFGMPKRQDVEKELLITLFNHNGVVKDFSTGEEIVDEIAFKFNLSDDQRKARLKTIYKKENRLKTVSLWHRLLFRAADYLAKEGMIIHPKTTLKLTGKNEWMLTELGYDQALKLLNLPVTKKDLLLTKSFEIQKVVEKLISIPKPQKYCPFDNTKKKVKITKEITYRQRGFRQAVIESYDYKCAFCGMKIKAPDSNSWEVEAAHIVPHSHNGKDDIWNGLALCRHHHWTFDVGWLTLDDNFKIAVSSKINSIPKDFGNMYDINLLKIIYEKNKHIYLPKDKNLSPHINSIKWHKDNIFIP